MSDSETLRRERQEDLYWRTVRATLETVFNENPDRIAEMERAYREGPPLDRAVLYNMEPLELAADFLDVTPTAAQRESYRDLVNGVLSEPTQEAAPVPTASHAAGNSSTQGLPTQKPERLVAPVNRGVSVMRSFNVLGGRCSIRLESIVWEGLEEICRREKLDLHDVVSRVAENMNPAVSLTSAIRVFAFGYFRMAASMKEEKYAAPGAGELRLVVANSLQEVRRIRPKDHRTKLRRRAMGRSK